MLVSIAIPAHNEERYIADCLRSIARQRTAAETEVIVCINACTDWTRYVVSQVAEQEGVKLRLVNEPVKGIARARQRTFQEATGDIVLSADADTEYPPYWVEGIITDFRRRPETMLVYGPVYFKNLHGFPGKLTSHLYPAIDFLITLFDWVVGRPNVRGANFAVRVKAFRRVGGFNIKLTVFEDNDFAWRLGRLQGSRCLYYDPRLVVYSSARRYNYYGLWGGVLYYLKDYFRMFILKKKVSTFQDVRA